MKTVILLLMTAARLLAQGDPNAAAEAAAGLALAREGKYTLAIPHYRKALELDRNIPGLYLNLGLAYFKTDNLPEAAAAFALQETQGAEAFLPQQAKHATAGPRKGRIPSRNTSDKR